MSNYTFTKIEQNTNSRPVLADGMIALSKTGRIGLGRRFAEQYDLDTDSRASLYWDNRSKAIAISFKAAAGNEQASGQYVQVHPTEGYTVGFVKGNAGYIMSSNFFQQIGVDPSEHVGQYRYEVLKGREAGIAEAADSEVFVVRLEGGS